MVSYYFFTSYNLTRRMGKSTEVASYMYNLIIFVVTACRSLMDVSIYHAISTKHQIVYVIKQTKKYRLQLPSFNIYKNKLKDTKKRWEVKREEGEDCIAPGFFFFLKMHLAFDMSIAFLAF